MELRPETPADALAVRAVHLAAFGGADEADIVDALRLDASAYIPALSLAALLEDTVVGHVVSTRARFEGAEILVLGPIAVDPARQGQGIGAALMEESIRVGRDLGFAGIVLIGHPSYYPRFGFRPLASYGLSAPIDVPADVAMALELKPGSLCGLSGVVRYPAAFGLP